MAEGDTHRELVRCLRDRISGETGPTWSLFVDGGAFGERTGVTPTIGDFRPDILAIDRVSRRTLIGEAKTIDDVDNRHTQRQLEAYFDYLAAEGDGGLWIAVPLLAAGTAHRVCRLARARLGLTRIPFSITGWLLGPKPFVQTWHG